MKIKVSSDIEKAKSILKMIESRERSIEVLERSSDESLSTVICENYYEIIKEICVGIALIEGYKFIGENAHKELIEFIRYSELSEWESGIVDDLRMRRNKSSYEGKQIEPIYLDNNKKSLLEIIAKLKGNLKDKLGGET